MLDIALCFQAGTPALLQCNSAALSPLKAYFEKKSTSPAPESFFQVLPKMPFVLNPLSDILVMHSLNPGQKSYQECMKL